MRNGYRLYETSSGKWTILRDRRLLGEFNLLPWYVTDRCYKTRKDAERAADFLSGTPDRETE